MGYKEVFKRNALDSSFTLSKNMVVNGDIKGDVSGRIEGHIFGNVCVQGKVVIADSGIIEGDISGSDVVVQGLVKGNIIASNSLQVEPEGQVMGSVTSLSIFVDSQATIKGIIRKVTSLSEIELLISANSNKIDSSLLQKLNSVEVIESNSLQSLKPQPLNSLHLDQISNDKLELHYKDATNTQEENVDLLISTIKLSPIEKIEEETKNYAKEKTPDRWW